MFFSLDSWDQSILAEDDLQDLLYAYLDKYPSTIVSGGSASVVGDSSPSRGTSSSLFNFN